MRFARALFGQGRADPRTFQERLWAGPFGDDYTARNLRAPENDIALFRKIFGRMRWRPWSVIELGAGSGSNLAAIKAIDHEIELTGLEINPKALANLAQVADEAIEGSLLRFEPERTWSTAMTKGVLIHIAPEDLPAAYRCLYRCAARYVVMAEYYNPTPQQIQYRGYSRALWRRDFAGEFMAQYPDFHLVDYGFVYHGDPFPQDDITWFLMEKQ